MADESNYEKEIETYLERLRKISYYQRYILVPFLLLMAGIQIYQGYYSRSWWDVVTLVAYVFGALYNWYDARRTFAKIMLRKLVG